MFVYIIGKPRNQEELEAIWGHENIIFVDTIEEYEQHRLTSKKPDLVWIDDVEPVKPTVHVLCIDGPQYNKPLVAELMTPLANFDMTAIEARVLAGSPDLVIDSMAYALKAVIKNLPEPITAKCADDRRRHSKGDKHRNRRYRWS